jgi:hypothetical protein
MEYIEQAILLRGSIAVGFDSMNLGNLTQAATMKLVVR